MIRRSRIEPEPSGAGSDGQHESAGREIVPLTIQSPKRSVPDTYRSDLPPAAMTAFSAARGPALESERVSVFSIDSTKKISAELEGVTAPTFVESPGGGLPRCHLSTARAPSPRGPGAQ